MSSLALHATIVNGTSKNRSYPNHKMKNLMMDGYGISFCFFGFLRHGNDKPSLNPCLGETFLLLVVIPPSYQCQSSTMKVQG